MDTKKIISELVLLEAMADVIKDHCIKLRNLIEPKSTVSARKEQEAREIASALANMHKTMFRQRKP